MTSDVLAAPDLVRFNLTGGEGAARVSAQLLWSRSRGVVFTGTVLLELAQRGVSRVVAYVWVQRNAMRAFHEQRDFKGLLLADAELTAVLPSSEIERAFDLDEQLKHVGHVFSRVFQEVAV